MTALLLIRDARALRAVEPLKRLHRVDAEVWQLLEDFVGGVRVVVGAYPGVVPAEHVMRAAQVLPDDGVENRLPGPGVAHVPEQEGRHVDVLGEVARLTEGVVRHDDRLVDVVAGSLLTDDGVR